TEAGERANGYLKQPMTRDQSLAELLRRPEIAYQHIAEIGAEKAEDPVVADQVEIEIKYEGYISRQTDEIERLRKNGNNALPV
ncbi:tRNA uridine-5-carboxymethylaminomethyl(34) synthesis enzyme MnmG, partial [Pantoea sp. SIMBA_133]